MKSKRPEDKGNFRGLKNFVTDECWGHGLSGEVPVQQAQVPEFKTSVPPKKYFCHR
jgi:hypothetical protein